MGRKAQYTARSGLRDERWFEPAFGAVHRVHHTEELDEFVADLVSGVSKLPPIEFHNDKGLPTSEKPVASFFNPARLSLRVIERRLTQRYGKRNKFQWHPADRARIEQNIADEIGKYDIGGRTIEATMKNVARFGDPDVALQGGRVLAIVPEAESPEADFFAIEHEIAVNGIRSSMGRFRTTAPYLPHISIGRIRHEASPEAAANVINLVKTMLPLDVSLNPIEFTPRRH